VTELLPPAALAGFLDRHGLGSGPVRATPIGEGQSNLTYRLERGDARVVLRRPPPPPLPPSAHDVVREARIQAGLARGGVPVPRILAVEEDEDVLGAPFYVMEEIDGVIVGDALPEALDVPDERLRLGLAVVDGLADLHAADWRACGLEGLGRPAGYLERQLRRWADLWERNATRELPEVLELGETLRATLPDSPRATVVHGDYRLGNLMVARTPPARLLAILDWEMATIGDPLADLGYLVATWSQVGAVEHPLLLSPVTARPGFPTRAQLVERYAQRTGRDVARLAWYQAFALWKAVVFSEAIYGRFVRGERDDAFAASLETGVPRLLEAALGQMDVQPPSTASTWPVT
jgi:aminoglycoside phosphotransferase (APT) family kinase protein